MTDGPVAANYPDFAEAAIRNVGAVPSPALAIPRDSTRHFHRRHPVQELANYSKACEPEDPKRIGLSIFMV